MRIHFQEAETCRGTRAGNCKVMDPMQMQPNGNAHRRDVESSSYNRSYSSNWTRGKVDKLRLGVKCGFEFIFVCSPGFKVSHLFTRFQGLKNVYEKGLVPKCA